MPPRKNKRGARGSTEEDPNAAKRLNMASKEEEAAAAEDEIAHGVAKKNASLVFSQSLAFTNQN